MAVPTRRILDPIFGEPVLRYQNNGMAGWCKENSVSQWQKGSGWTVNLYGGAQSGYDDWAAIFIPVNEMKLVDLKSAQWTYYMTNAETMGVNMVIWVHDPDDFENRAEITQLGNISGLAKAQYWNHHALNTATDQFFFGGENTTGTGLTADPPNYYGLDDFQADALFLGWTIYRISFEYGWDASGTFDDAWVADIKINNQRILLKPSAGDHIGTEVKTLTAKTSATPTTVATLITGVTAKRIRIISVNCSSMSSVGAEFEVYFVAGTNMDTTPTNAIFAASLVANATATYSTAGTASISFPDGAGPVGGIGEAVAIRTGADIGTGGRVTVVYREE